MAVRIGDTLKQLNNADFPIVEATDVAFSSGDSLQKLYDEGSLGGDNSQTLTEAEYLALPEEERLNNSYYLYDIGVHYKNGVAYSRKKPIQLTMEEYKALGEVDPDQEYIISADAEGILLEASDIGYSNAVSNLPCTTVQGAIDKIDGKVEEISRMKIYTNVKQLGLESECSTVDIFKAMPNNSLAIIGTFPVVSDEYCMLIDRPISYDGLLTITKFNHARFSIEYKLSGGDTEYPNRMYVGNFAGSEPTTIDWQELATMDKVDSIPLIYNQNTDILAYALTCPQEKRTLVRIYSANATNNPYGVSTDTDFIYEIDKINFNDLFITVRAKDVKNNREFINTKNETKWSGWKELATMDKVVNSIIRESKSTLYNLNNVDNIEVAIDITKSGYKPIAVSLLNSGKHLWFAQGIYFDDTVCNLSLRGATPSSATNAECKVLVTYIKTS